MAIARITRSGSGSQEVSTSKGVQSVKASSLIEVDFSLYHSALSKKRDSKRNAVKSLEYYYKLNYNYIEGKYYLTETEFIWHESDDLGKQRIRRLNIN